MTSPKRLALFTKRSASLVLAILLLCPGASFAADIIVNNETELRNALSTAASGDRILMNQSGAVPTFIYPLQSLDGTVSGFILDGGKVGEQLGQILGDRMTVPSYLINLGAATSINGIQNIEIINGVSSTEGLAGALTVGNVTGTIHDTAFRRNSTTSSEGGGGLYIGGDFTGSLGRDTHFNTNAASAGSGGGMLVNGSFLGRIEGGGGKDVHFDSNTAALHGGGLFVRDNFGAASASTRIYANHFSANRAGGNGGGLYVGQSFFAHLGDYAFFDRNLAEGSGGGMYVGQDFTGNIGAIVMFIENSAGPGAGATATPGANGGGMYVGGALTGNMWLATFTGNKAGGDGAGMYTDRISGTFGGGNVFTGNIAQGSGGGMYMAGSQGAGSAGFSGIMNDSNFFDNKAVTGDGGAIAIAGGADWAGLARTDGNGNIYHMAFARNEAGGSGGAISVSGAMRGIDIELSTFENNKALAGSGGAISSGAITGPIRTNTFTGNTAGGSGGAINSTGTLAGTLKDNNFRSNTAGGDGGAINLSGDLQGPMDGNTFRDNKAGGDGGGMNLRNMVGKNSDSFFADNTAGGSGGAMNFSGAIQGDIENSSFSGNKATGGDGGAINAASMTGNIVGFSSFSSNTAGSGGGAINLSGALKGNIDYALFQSNQAAGGSGGAINAGSISGSITGGTSFVSNIAGGDGGAINTGTMTGNITLGYFASNRAGGSGGAINAASINGDFSTVSFSSNTAGGDGGAVNAPTFSGGIRSSAFSDNSATGDGGAVNAPAFSGSIRSTSFSNNSATGRGGALAGMPTLVEETRFVGNSAADGGAIYGASGNGTQINASVFSGNKAGSDGGAVYLAQGVPLAVRDTSFWENTAGGRGGALHGLPSLIEESLFLGNKAAEGGALYGTGGSGTQIRDTTFNGNEATNNGGAAFFSQGVPITLHNTQIADNTAGGQGGGIYFDMSSSANYDVVLSADADNSTSFTGNTDSSGSNSFYVGGTAAGSRFNLSTAGAGDIELIDPFKALIGASAFNLTHNAPDALLVMSGTNDITTAGGSVGLNFLSGTSRLVRDSGDFTLRVNGQTDTSMTWGQNNTLTIVEMDERSPNLALIDLTGSTGGKDFVIENGATLDLTRVLQPLPNQRYLLVDGLNPGTGQDNVRVGAIRLLSPDGYSMVPMFEANGTQLWLDNIIIPDPFDPRNVPINLVDAEACISYWLNHTENGLELTPMEVLALRRDLHSGPPEAAASMALVGVDIHNTGVEAARLGFMDRGAGSLRQGDFRFWTNYVGGIGRSYNKNRFSGYNVHTNGILVGAVWDPSPVFNVGGYAGYSHSDTGFRSVSAKAESNTTHAGMQASYRTPWGVKLTANTGYSYHSVATERTPGGLGKDSGDFNQNVLGTGLEISYEVPVAEKTRLIPAASVTATWMWQDSFKETGKIMAAAVDSVRGSNVVSSLGVSLEHDFLFEEENGDGRVRAVTPGIGVTWKHQYTGRQRRVDYGFMDNGCGTGYSCTAKSREMGADFLEVQGYITGSIQTENAEWSIRAGYGVELGEKSVGHMFYGGVAVEF